MTENKGIFFSVVVYLLDIIHQVYSDIRFLPIILTDISYNKTNKLPLSSISILTIFVMLSELIIELLIMVGLIKLKKWGYNLAILYGIFIFIVFLFTLFSKSPDYFLVLIVAAGIVLKMNKKVFE